MFTVRRAVSNDVDQLLAMMLCLAEFEGYLDRFRVSIDDLLERAFGDSPQCSILVADDQDGTLLGYAVYLVQPFTYDLRPSVTLKELFVAFHRRRRGVGEALLKRLRLDAQEMSAGRILWLVLPSNHPAKNMYQRFGGSADTYWEHWQCELPDRCA